MQRPWLTHPYTPVTLPPPHTTACNRRSQSGLLGGGSDQIGVLNIIHMYWPNMRSRPAKVAPCKYSTVARLGVRLACRSLYWSHTLLSLSTILSSACLRSGDPVGWVSALSPLC